jgi:SAM-dependent methyltransferase
MTGPDYVLRNRKAWERLAEEYVEPGRRNWSSEPGWGIWPIPETEARLLPSRLDGMRTLELGCGTAYVSAWLARRGASPVGLDNSPAQLATARALQREFGLEFPLIHGIAEQVPFPDGCFDLVISEYGASIWSDPYLWIPEAARLLRPGGELTFLVNATLLVLCLSDDENVPADATLKRDYFGLHRIEYPGEIEVEFQLGHGDWIRLLRSNGFEVLDLIELRAPAGATTRYPWVTSDWARRWPSEEVWRARKRG